MRRLTTEQFINRAKKIHDNKYDYSLVQYKNSNTKVKIICPIHGIFEQRACDHLNGRGCRNCQYENIGKNKKKTTEQFIIDAYCVHGDRYNYKLVDYKNARSKVKIICPIHGEFKQKTNDHTNNKNGCPKCSHNISRQEIEIQEWLKGVMRRLTTQQFIDRARKVHGNKYDYSLVQYKNSNTKVKIICTIHGIFEQKPNHHLRGQGCKKCSIIHIHNKQRKSSDEFIEEAKKTHNNKYDYSLVQYKNRNTKVKIICPIHGIFEQRPNNHLKYGCKKCGSISSKNKQTKSLDIFIKEAKEAHDNKYDYSLVQYKNAHTKVKIICPIHGVFEQKPDSHLRGQGCKKCGSISSKNKQTKSLDIFIKEAKEAHGNKYDYSLVQYKNSNTKVKIICHDHGIFEQRLGNHIYLNHGCPKCSHNVSRQEIEIQEWLKNIMKKYNTEQFIEKAVEIHGDRYNYKLIDYKDSNTKVKIICPIHGVFEQTPNNHLNLKQGCPKCSKYTIGGTTEQFINRSRIIHNNKYDYSLTEYTGSKNDVKIICPIHGVFEQRADHHMNGRGCKKCQYDIISSNIKKSTQQFIEDAYCVHGDKYNYKLVEYKNAHHKVKIICPIHGEFEQTPDSHLYQLCGCPKCSHNISRQEIEIQEWLKELDKNNIICNDRQLINPFELDIVIPDKKLAIEFNGLYWHSEQRGKGTKYHLNKYLKCKEKGYRLIQIWESEWLFKKDIVKSILLNAMGINKRVIHGRKCKVKLVKPKEARPMYNENHIQGFRGGTHLGLYFEDELVSLMTIDKRGELQRFVNLKYTKVHGAFSKLLKAFIKYYNFDEIYTFADFRYFTGNVYTNNGFVYQYTTKPNYYYIKGYNTIHRRMFQKKNIERMYNKGELKYWNPDQTEYQNMLMNEYDRIWDCGNAKYIMKVK